jgi:hypothetical protein
LAWSVKDTIVIIDTSKSNPCHIKIPNSLGWFWNNISSSIVYTDDSHGVCIWNTADSYQQWFNTKSFGMMVLGSDGIIAGADQIKIGVADINTKKLLWENEDNVEGITFAEIALSPSNLLASLTGKKTIIVWRNKSEHVEIADGEYEKIKWLPSGELIGVDSTGSLSIWDVTQPSPHCVATLAQGSAVVTFDCFKDKTGIQRVTDPPTKCYEERN